MTRRRRSLGLYRGTYDDDCGGKSNVDVSFIPEPLRSVHVQNLSESDLPHFRIQKSNDGSSHANAKDSCFDNHEETETPSHASDLRRILECMQVFCWLKLLNAPMLKLSSTVRVLRRSVVSESRRNLSFDGHLVRSVRVECALFRPLRCNSVFLKGTWLLFFLATMVCGQQQQRKTSTTAIAPSTVAAASSSTNRITNTAFPIRSPATTLITAPYKNVTLAPSKIPTMLPAIRPTASPSSRPTNSHAPTVNPTKSHHPSHVPSLLPTSFPSSVLNSTSKGLFRQDFVMDAVDSQFFNETQNETLARILESYTSDFAPDQGVLAEIVTVCLIDDQSGSIDKQNRTINSVDYSCQYTSRVKNVTSFADLFLTYINANTAKLTFDMQAQLLPVNASLQATVRKILSPAPTVSAQPSSEPTIVPTVSSPPSLFPSKSPSAGPSRPHLPTTPPMFLRLTPAPSKAPTHTSNHLPHAGAIVAIVVLMGLIFLVGLFFYYRYWKKKREQSIRPPRAETTVAAAPTTSQQSSGGRSSRRLRAISRTNLLWNSNNTNGSQAPTAVTVSSAVALTDDRTDQNIVLSPTESILSNQSLLSEGESGLGDDSGDELDGTNNLQDEFDQYKDQNLEQLRADVEGNLSGFEGIMSAAVTNALMEDEDTNVETQELLWGCKPNADGTVIEASALFEVSDWLTRNESAEGERKRAFMQEILNKMVTSVRHGVIVAEDASRTIHESAAILGLQLAEELPTTTVIISGMRKTTTADDMIKALQEFGDIDVAAVASGRRGFGILRFRRRKSVDRALRRYKSGEIVILDVSIQMKVLMPSGAVESR